MDRPRIRVDFNEWVEVGELVLLSKHDLVEDSAGSSITLEPGLRVFVYERNLYDDGEEEYLLAEGVAELNDLTVNPEWTRNTRWCLQTQP